MTPNSAGEVRVVMWRHVHHLSPSRERSQNMRRGNVMQTKRVVIRRACDDAGGGLGTRHVRLAVRASESCPGNVAGPGARTGSVETAGGFWTARPGGWKHVGRTLIGETHRYTLTAAICTLRPAFVPIIPTTFDTAAPGSHHHHLATRSKLCRVDRCGLLTRRAGRDVRADMSMRRVKAIALRR